MFGLAIGDALGIHVDRKPRSYMVENPVKDLNGGGRWDLKKGQVIKYRNRIASEYINRKFRTITWIF